MFGETLENTVEEFEHIRCGKNVNLKSSIPFVKATTHPRSAGRINFVALSFLVNGQYFKDYHKILGNLGLDHVGLISLSGSILLNGLHRS